MGTHPRLQAAPSRCLPAGLLQQIPVSRFVACVDGKLSGMLCRRASGELLQGQTNHDWLSSSRDDDNLAMITCAHGMCESSATMPCVNRNTGRFIQRLACQL